MKIELINYQNLKFDKNLKLFSKNYAEFSYLEEKNLKKLIFKEVIFNYLKQKLLKFLNFRVKNGTDPKLL